MECVNQHLFQSISILSFQFSPSHILPLNDNPKLLSTQMINVRESSEQNEHLQGQRPKIFKFISTSTEQRYSTCVKNVPTRE